MTLLFDLGGVFLSWKPHTVVSNIVSDTTLATKILENLFGHQDWRDFDQGTVDKTEVVRRVSSRSEISRDLIEECIDAAMRSLVLDEDVDEIRENLRTRGIKVVVLSNMPKPFARYLDDRLGLQERFDGILYSGCIGLLKPDPRIFRRAIDDFNLTPHQTLFVDDREENTQAAALLEFQVHHFKGCEGLKKRLESMDSP